jgi:thiol:disulfide interchange protein DsbC
MFDFIRRALIASLIVMLPALPISADEGDLSANDEVLRLLKLRLGTDNVEPARETRADGVYQTRFGNKFAYLIDGGRYVFIGEMVDLEMAQNLTELSRRDLAVEEFANFPEQDVIVFPAKDEELAVLNVLTDTSCGYCQQLHKEVRYLQEAGISVHYYPYPRGGARGPGYSDMRRVWCSEDKLEAMSIAKKAESGTLQQDGSCKQALAVDEGYLLGNRLGINGTPALFASDGAAFPGYVPHQQLIPQLLNQ